jgi:hypothetical protein
LHNLAAFDPVAYRKLSVQDKFKHFKTSLKSIRDTLNPEKSLENISLRYIIGIKDELQEYLKFIGPVVNDDEPAMTPEEIRFLERSCKSISSVHAALKEAIKWLRVAIDVEKKTTKPDIQARAGYYDCLDNCFNALNRAIRNI